MIRLLIAEPVLRSLRGDLARGAVLTATAAVWRVGADIDLVVPEGPRPVETVELRVLRIPPSLPRLGHQYWWTPHLGDTERLELGLHAKRGCSAAWISGGRVHAVDELCIVGPRMESWRPGLDVPELRGAMPESGAFSRTIAALGGRAIHDRLCQMPMAVVGAGRLGSLLAVELARLGVQDLVAVDADVFEEHSAEAIEADAADVDVPKVEAIARRIERVAPRCRFRGVRAEIGSEAGIAACLSGRVLCTAPDDNGARLAVASLASAALRPHLDLGCLLPLGREFAGAADIRLIVPPRGGCLACVGGLDLEPRPTAWQEQRAGSLRALNMLAVAQGLLLFQRFMAGDLAGTTWLRVDIDARGVARVTERNVDRAAPCRVCGGGKKVS